MRATATRDALQDTLDGAARGVLEKIGDPAPDLEVLASWRSTRARKALLLKVATPTGVVRSRWVDDAQNVEMLGSGEARLLAGHELRTMGFGDFQDVGMDEAQTLAYKVIADVAANTDDVGEPVRIGAVTADGVQILDDADIEGIRDSAGRFTSDIRGLLAPERLPSESPTRDRGLGPPAA